MLRAHQGVRRFIVGSQWMRRQLVSNGIEADRVRVLPPVPSSLATTSPQPSSDRPEILFVGPVIHTKGVDLLLRALTKVRGPWHTTIIGTGNALDACKALAKELDIAHCVTFTGWVHHEDLDDYYARAAVSIVPSRWPEPFGMVGIEAMARGRPVVGFAVGGIPDWLEHGVTGLLAPEADTDALGAHIQTLLQDNALAHRLGEQAAERVRERFQPDAFRGSLLQILAEAS
jgi:glycosyltransferase involved in cell wall biosynthesis